MNTSFLKRFAQLARLKLLTQVAARLELVLGTDSAELRDKASQLRKLREEINASGKQQVIDKVAYTWFNRLMALRFMDVNDYQPLNLRIVTPRDGNTLPEILQEAKQGHIPDELPVKKQHIFDLLDGRIPAANPQNEAYKELLIGACNRLHQVFPFMFERINDYTELLLPDDLTSEFSIVHDVREGMQPADCSEVEIIGWLYQFYISEWNEELIKSKKSYKKHEIAPASQLFTPSWIVRYLVDNTLGQLWTELKPETKITDKLEFYIKPAYKDQLQQRKYKSIEEVRFFDPCVGSAHILSYAFDVFYLIYEEQGYNPGEIPELIITKNLFGTDIDERAAQLSAFVLMMKGRQHQRRFFTQKIKPNILFYRDFPEDARFKNASVLGSLIQIEEDQILKSQENNTTLFAEKQEELVQLYKMLGQRYDLVVTNPPYISSSRMEGSLKQYVEANYPDTKSDLFATFVLRCLELCNEDGLTGLMTPFVWMFISSYEKLRKEIIKKHFINNLIQLEYSGFDGATVPICTFTLRNNPITNAKGSYIRLSDFKGAQNQAPKTLQAIQNPKCGWFFTTSQKDFENIPGSPIGYWLNEVIKDSFTGEAIKNYTVGKAGIVSGDDNDFFRLWHEINNTHISFKELKHDYDSQRWVPIMKGGPYRKYYGNFDYIINIKNLYTTGRTNKSVRRGDRNFYFKKAITWTYVTSSKTAFRLAENAVFSTAAPSLFLKNDSFTFYLLGLLNSKLVEIILPSLNPTLNMVSGDIAKIPTIFEAKKKPLIDELMNFQYEISKIDWNIHETSWDFLHNELLRLSRTAPHHPPPTTHHPPPTTPQPLPTIYQHYKTHWSAQFFQLHQNEEELNRQFIDIYGLQEELTPDVPLEEITILQQELDRTALAKLSKKYRSGWKLVDGEWKKVDGGRWMVDGSQSPTTTHQQPTTTHQQPTTTHQPPILPFNDKEVMAQFISYAVGCMFGRYSLDKEGLILANQGETLADYVKKVAGEWWTVDGEGNFMFNQKIYDNEQSKEFQGAADMAARYGTDQKRLHPDEENAQGRIVWPDESDQAGLGERAEQHSRRPGEGNQRVYPLSEDSQRIAGRTGNPTDPDQRTGDDRASADNSAYGIHREPGQADQRPHQQTPITHAPPTTAHHPPITFLPDDDNIIPVLNEEWFEDDIVVRFHAFLKAAFGSEHFKKNLEFIEDALGKDIRKYFNKDFYPDHIRRYKKRPIYWQFSSPKGAFNVLIYMHRYTPDTINLILNKYLRQFIEKLRNQAEQLEHLKIAGTVSEQSKAVKEKERLSRILLELQEYEREIIFPLATERIPIDLDDGVLVNYNKFGRALKEVTGLNDKKTKAKVRGFEWIDGRGIR